MTDILFMGECEAVSIIAEKPLKAGCDKSHRQNSFKMLNSRPDMP